MLFGKKTFLIGLPLLIASVIAGQVMFGSKITGEMVAAHWDGGQTGSVDITPADTPDGAAYSIFWRACTLNPDFAHRYCVYAGGLAPRATLKTHAAGQIAIAVDSSILSVRFTLGGEDCRSGTCIPFVPASVPLNGVFTIYRGNGSWAEQSSGNSSRQDMPFGGVVFSQSFSGNKTRYSAQFAGIVGPLTVAADPNVANAWLTIMKGQQTYQTVYPPAP